jgi:ATP/maltotriose-dependent transcriptional regulator MalT/DNA-binding SARP family transcriptional activator
MATEPVFSGEEFGNLGYVQLVVTAYVPQPRDLPDPFVPPRGRPVEGPRAGGEYVERPSVERLLNRATGSRIKVVIGAAGWGKTTTVASWSRRCATAWLQYEDHEGVSERLLNSLSAVLQVHLSAPTEDMAALNTDQVESAATAICLWMQDFLRKDLVLVFDDLHELQPESEAALVVEVLCQRVPDRVHLVLISRGELPFSLQRLRGRGLVTEIYAPNLAFDVLDVETLLRRTVGKQPPGLAGRVWEYTGGWPTAVHCAVEMVRMVGLDQRFEVVGRLSHPGERFHDYLAEEVIGTAPRRVQQLLRRLAILGEVRSMTITEPGCEITTSATDTTTGLAELSRQGLVQRGGPHNTWSLVRPLRDYFEHEAALSSSERATLHITAAKECLGQGAPADALRHLLAAGDHAACASILVDHGDAMVERGEPDAVLAATQLPSEHLDDPRIQQVLGLAQLARGQWTQALTHFQHAGCNRHELAPALAWRVGWTAFARGEFTEVHALVQRTRLDRRDTVDETRVLALAASAHWMAGDLKSLRKMALQTRAAARQCGNPRAWSSAHQVLALLAAAEGDWRQADAHYADALHNAETSKSLPQLTWIRACQAFNQFEAGAPQHALADAQIALNLSEQCEDPFLTGHALTTRGRAQARLGALEPAAGDFATAIDLFQRLGSRFLAWPLCGLGDLYRTRCQVARARAVYEEALTLAEPCHDVFGLSSALIGLARIDVAEDPQRARERADRAVELDVELRKVPSLLARGWITLMEGDRAGASADANRAAVAARQRRDKPGLAEAITLGVLASRDPAMNANSLQEAIDIWQETSCRLEEAVTRVVAAHIGAAIPHLDAYHADKILRDYGVDVGSRKVAGPLSVLVRSAPTVFIQTLGVFRVIRDGVQIPNTAWQSKKARDLLKILIARRRPTPREQLMELLWPGVGPTVAGNRLSVLLSTVRDVLQSQPTGEPPLTAADGAVALNRSQVSIDVEDFLAQANAAFDAYRVGEPDATAQLVAAIAAHTGDFLENDPYQEWASVITEEVRAAYIALLRALTAQLRDAGATDDAVRYTLLLLEQDHYDEEAYRTLIGVLFDAGRHGEARRHYQNYTRRMAEIDVPPSPFREMTSQRA